MSRGHRLCICGDMYGQHLHYRDGLDCSATGCPCLDYRAATWWRVRLAQLAARVARWRLAARARRGRHARAVAPGRIER